MKSIMFLVVILLLSGSALAQNSKGDKPAANPSGPFLRFPKKIFKSKSADRANTRDITGRRRIRTKNKSSANKVIYEAPNPYKERHLKKPGDRPTQARARTFSRPPGNHQQAFRGTLQGNRLRIRSVSAQRARHNVYPANGPYVNNSSKRPVQHTRAITRTSSGKRVKKRSASGSYVVRGKKDVYWGKFSKGERAFTKDLTGRSLRTRNFKSAGIGVGTTDTLKIPHRKPSRQRANSGKISGGYVSATGTRSHAWTGDVSGHPLRLRTGRKGETDGVYSMRAHFGSPKKNKKRNNPLPAKIPGVGAGGIGRALRNITGIRRSKGGGSLLGKRNNNGQPINVRAPGVGAVGLGNFSGNFKRGELSPGFNRGGAGYAGGTKSRRPLRGGGSATGKFKTNGQPISVRGPGMGANGMAKFQGNFRRGELTPGFSRGGAGFRGKIKGNRPLKGGGSISGRVWNNNRSPIQGRTGAPGSGRVATFQGNFRQGELSPGIGRQGYGYSGNVRARRPLKGGGSVSGKFLKNNRERVEVRGGAPGFDRPARFQGNLRKDDLPMISRQGYGYPGSMRTRRPPRGGGSVTGKFLKLNRQSIEPRGGAPGYDRPAHFQGNFLRSDMPGFGKQGYGFSGTIKAKKPKKGGGSISGKLLDNNGKAVDVRVPSSSEARSANYSGKMPLPFFKRIYVQNPKAFNASLKKKKPNPNTYLAEGLQVKDRQGKYQKKPHAAVNALPGIGPQDGTVKASEYARAMKMYWSYKHNPNSHDDAMKGIKPSNDLKRVVRFQGNTRLAANRKHNPSSHRDAMKVLEPGKAYARINDFAGNLKMKKYNDRQLHPDAQFAHGFRNNVKDERTMLMNFKLFWAKWFKKNDTQPGIVKEKDHRPRYDKKEKDLWKALYD